MKPTDENDNEVGSQRTVGLIVFRTTRWTRVLEARGDSSESKAALSELCAAYYAPVFAFIRGRVGDAESTRDLTQGFFARLLERHGLDTVNPQRGRFRSYLLGAVKHFLADAKARADRHKRGGGETPLLLSPETDTSPGLDPPDTYSPGPEREFDRQWTLTVLDHALSALSREQADAGRSTHFEVLKPWLTGDTEHWSQADAADRLGVNDGAVKVAIHRLRRRFRELVKAEIAQTLTNPAQVDEELKHLRESLG